MATFRIPKLCACMVFALIVPQIKLASLSVRTAETDAFGEKSVLIRVASLLEGSGIVWEERPLSASTGSFGSSLVADFPAAAPRNKDSGIGSLVFAIPLSTSPRAADAPLDYGVQAALALADRFRRSPPPLDVRIAFLGDEKTELPEDLRGGLSNAGLRDLADSYGAEAERPVFIYLDLPTPPRPPRLDHGSSQEGQGSLAPRNLVAALIDGFSSRALPLNLAMPYSELYRLALVRGPEELRILRERELSGVVISGNGLVAAKDYGMDPPTVESTAAALESAVVRLFQTAEEDEERYSIIAFGPSFRIFTEGDTVLVFVGASALFLFAFLVYSLTHRRLTVARLKVFVRRLWVILVFWIALFFCARAAGLVLSFLLGWAKTSASIHPNGAAAMKLFFLFSFYYAASPILSLKPFPRRAHFYGSAALACLSAGALIAAALNFSFVPIFIWAFALAFLSTATLSPSTAAIPAVLAPIQIAGAAAAAVGSGDPDTALAILNSDPFMELYFAFLALPFLFLFRRLSILSRARTIRRARMTSSAHGYRRYTRPILVAGALAAGVIFSRDTAEAARRRPLPVRGETADSDRFALAARDTTFLDRRIATLSLRAGGRPSRFDLRLSASSPITIYDAPVPYVLSDDGKSATFVLGERPPTPLDLEITLPASLAARFEAQALYYDEEKDNALSFRGDVAVGPAAAAGGRK